MFQRAAPREKPIDLPAVLGVNTSHLLRGSFSPPPLPAARISLRALYIPLTRLPTVKTSGGAECLRGNGTYGYLRAPWDRQKSELLSLQAALIRIWERMTKPCYFSTNKLAWEVHKHFWNSRYQRLPRHVFSTPTAILYVRQWGQLQSAPEFKGKTPKFIPGVHRRSTHLK